MRSAEHELFEAHIVRGAAQAHMRAMAEAMRPFVEASRRIGVAFTDAARSMQRAMRAIERASIRVDELGV